MRQTRFEKSKFFLLIFLFCMSLIQVGILWNYQSQGIPTNFLWNFFAKQISAYSIDKNEYFLPYRIIVSEGFDEAHWILNKKNEKFYTLWNDMKWYLEKILSSSGVVSCKDFNEEEWGSLAVKKAIVYEFRTGYNIEMLKFFLGMKAADTEVKEIRKILILPSEDINNNITIFLEGNNKVYKYVVGINQKGISRDEYDDIIYGMGQDDKNRSYRVIKEFFPNENKKPFEIRPDIPVIEDGEKYEQISRINCYNKYDFGNLNLQNNPNLSKLAKGVLGYDFENYDCGIDEKGAIVFKNLNDRYKIYKDGTMEYKYLYDVNEIGIVDEKKALSNTLEFINYRKNLIEGLDIILAGTKKDLGDENFTFMFDYNIGEIPIIFNDCDVNPKYNLTKNYAIIVVANDRRVINCKWILKNFSETDKGKMFNIRFTDLLEDVFEKYRISNWDDFSIYDIQIVYDIQNNYSMAIDPTWLVKDKHDKIYIVPMREKEGV